MDIQKMLKQAQKMQQEVEKKQKELASKEYEGTAGGGMVTATVTGGGKIVKISIDPSLLKAEEKELLEDLIVAAINQASDKSSQESSEAMSSAMQGMNLPPNFKMPF